jgi:hypothetical protein
MELSTFVQETYKKKKKRTFVNATMYRHPAIIKKRKKMEEERAERNRK